MAAVAVDEAHELPPAPERGPTSPTGYITALVNGER
jgi:hypothetical protein